MDPAMNSDFALFSRFVSEIAIDWNVIIAWKHIIYAVKKIPRFVSCFLMQISKVLSAFNIGHKYVCVLDLIETRRSQMTESLFFASIVMKLSDESLNLYDRWRRASVVRCAFRVYHQFVCAIDELEDFTRAFKSALIWNGLMYSLKLKTPWRRVFCMNASMTSAFSSVFLIWSIALIEAMYTCFWSLIRSICPA